MTRDQLLKDLNHASSLARDGAQTPLLGGAMGLMWGCLLIPVLILHGLILMGAMGVTLDKLGLLWFVFGVLGGGASVIMGRRITTKPGAGNLANRVSAALWQSVTILMFAFAIGVTLIITLKGASVDLFYMIMPIAFLLNAISLATIGAISELRYQKIAGIVAGVFMIITLMLYGNIASYFISALGVLAVIIIPSFIELRAETTHG